MRRLLQSLRSLFKPSPPKREESDGSQVVFPLAAIAIRPPAGWHILRTNLTQKDTDTQICEPMLMSGLGTISTVLFPADGLTAAQQADKFTEKSPLTLVERVEMPSAAGIKLVRLVTKDSETGTLSISHFFANQKGRVVMIYFLGEPAAAIQAGEMMVHSLRHKSDEG